MPPSKKTEPKDKYALLRQAMAIADAEEAAQQQQQGPVATAAPPAPTAPAPPAAPTAPAPPAPTPEAPGQTAMPQTLYVAGLGRTIPHPNPKGVNEHISARRLDTSGLTSPPQAEKAEGARGIGEPIQPSGVRGQPPRGLAEPPAGKPDGRYSLLYEAMEQLDREEAGMPSQAEEPVDPYAKENAREPVGTTPEGRTILQNADGSIATEETETLSDEQLGGWVNVPTMFEDGRKVSGPEALQRIKENDGKDPITDRPIKAYKTVEEAVAAAEQRSLTLGQQLQPREPGPIDPKKEVRKTQLQLAENLTPASRKALTGEFIGSDGKDTLLPPALVGGAVSQPARELPPHATKESVLAAVNRDYLRYVKFLERQGPSDALNEAEKIGMEQVPVLGVIWTVDKLINAWRAIHNLSEEGDEPPQIRDFFHLREFMFDLAEDMQEKTWTGKVQSIVKDIPAFMIEFMLSAGVLGAGKAATKAAALGLLRKGVNKKLTQALVAVSRTAVTAAIAVPTTPAGLGVTAPEFIKQRMPKFIELKDGQKIPIGGKDRELLGALAGAFLVGWGELFSEVSGVGISKGIGFVLKGVPGGKKLTTLRHVLQSKWVRTVGVRTGRTLDDAVRQGGYNGIVSEILEERLNDWIQSAELIWDEDAELPEHLTDWNKFLEHLSVEAAAFAVIPGAKIAGGLTYSTAYDILGRANKEQRLAGLDEVREYLRGTIEDDSVLLDSELKKVDEMEADLIKKYPELGPAVIGLGPDAVQEIPADAAAVQPEPEAGVPAEAEQQQVKAVEEKLKNKGIVRGKSPSGFVTETIVGDVEAGEVDRQPVTEEALRKALTPEEIELIRPAEDAPTEVDPKQEELRLSAEAKLADKGITRKEDGTGFQQEVGAGDIDVDETVSRDVTLDELVKQEYITSEEGEALKLPATQESRAASRAAGIPAGIDAVVVPGRDISPEATESAAATMNQYMGRRAGFRRWQTLRDRPGYLLGTTEDGRKYLVTLETQEEAYKRVEAGWANLKSRGSMADSMYGVVGKELQDGAYTLLSRENEEGVLVLDVQANVDAKQKEFHSVQISQELFESLEWGQIKHLMDVHGLTWPGQFTPQAETTIMDAVHQVPMRVEALISITKGSEDGTLIEEGLHSLFSMLPEEDKQRLLNDQIEESKKEDKVPIEGVAAAEERLVKGLIPMMLRREGDPRRPHEVGLGRGGAVGRSIRRAYQSIKQLARNIAQGMGLLDEKGQINTLVHQMITGYAARTGVTPAAEMAMTAASRMAARKGAPIAEHEQKFGDAGVLAALGPVSRSLIDARNQTSSTDEIRELVREQYPRLAALSNKALSARVAMARRDYGRKAERGAAPQFADQRILDAMPDQAREVMSAWAKLAQYTGSVSTDKLKAAVPGIADLSPKQIGNLVQRAKAHYRKAEKVAPAPETGAAVRALLGEKAEPTQVVLGRTFADLSEEEKAAVQAHVNEAITQEIVDDDIFDMAESNAATYDMTRAALFELYFERKEDLDEGIAAPAAAATRYAAGNTANLVDRNRTNKKTARAWQTAAAATRYAVEAREFKGEMGADILPMITDALYKNDMGAVLVKELTQNVLDAFADRLEADESFTYADGVMNMTVDSQERTLYTEDTGIGMLPDQVQNHFLKVRGTSKADQEDRIGKFGVAKTAILGAAAKSSNPENWDEATIQLETTAIDPETGGRVTTRMWGDGPTWREGIEAQLKGWKKADIPTLKGSVEENSQKPVGTKLFIKMDTVSQSGDALEFNKGAVFNYMNSLLQFSKFQWTTNIVFDGDRVEGRFYDARDKPDHLLTTLSLPAGDAEIWISRSENRTESLYNVNILNNGMLQLEHPIIRLVAEAVVPNYITVDIKPKVKASSRSYPFTTARDDLKGPVRTAVIKYLRSTLAKDAIEKETENYRDGVRKSKEVMVVGSDKDRMKHIIFDPTGEMPDVIMHDLSQRPYAKRLTKALEKAFKKVQKRLYERTLDPRYKGAFWSGFDTYIEEAGLNMQTASINKRLKPNAVFINPYIVLQNIIDRPASWVPETTAMAEILYAVILHELTHQVEWRENKLSGPLTYNISNAADVQKSVINSLKKVLNEIKSEDSGAQWAQFVRDAEQVIIHGGTTNTFAAITASAYASQLRPDIRKGIGADLLSGQRPERAATTGRRDPTGGGARGIRYAAESKQYSREEWEEKKEQGRRKGYREAPEGLKGVMAEHEGTPFHGSVMDALAIRREISAIIYGRKIETPRLKALKGQTLLNYLKEQGVEGGWRYVHEKGVMSSAEKVAGGDLWAVNSSLINCDPSDDCAKYCYATGRNYSKEASMVKAELVDMLAKQNPVRMAHLIAMQYKKKAVHTIVDENGKKKKIAVWDQLALRFFDKGDFDKRADGSSRWMEVLKEVNTYGIRVQVFTKHPSLLLQVPEFNLRLLSIDNTRLWLAQGNDLQIAFVYKGREDLPFIKKYADRMGVILPVKMSNGRLLPPEELKPLKEVAIEYGIGQRLCPIDMGWKQLGSTRKKNIEKGKAPGPGVWQCTKCDTSRLDKYDDHAKGVGCFFESRTRDIVVPDVGGRVQSEIDAILSKYFIGKEIGDATKLKGAELKSYWEELTRLFQKYQYDFERAGEAGEPLGGREPSQRTADLTGLTGLTGLTVKGEDRYSAAVVQAGSEQAQRIIEETASNPHGNAYLMDNIAQTLLDGFAKPMKGTTPPRQYEAAWSVFQSSMGDLAATIEEQSSRGGSPGLSRAFPGGAVQEDTMRPIRTMYGIIHNLFGDDIHDIGMKVHSDLNRKEPIYQIDFRHLLDLLTDDNGFAIRSLQIGKWLKDIRGEPDKWNVDLGVEEILPGEAGYSFPYFYRGEPQDEWDAEFVMTPPDVRDFPDVSEEEVYARIWRRAENGRYEIHLDNTIYPWKPRHVASTIEEAATWVRQNNNRIQLIKEGITKATYDFLLPGEPATRYAAGVQTVITKNDKGREFLTLYGNTFDIKDKLGKKGLGFRYFQGRWSKAVDFIDDDQRAALNTLGVDTSILDVAEEPPEAPPAEPGVAAAVAPGVAEARARVKQALTAKQAGDKVKGLMGFIDTEIDKLGSLVDTAASSATVKDFLSFTSRFWKYSFTNQMLIWIQNPEASHVAGGKQWFEKFGREVTDWDAGISIIAPRTAVSRKGREAKAQMSPAEWDSAKGQYTYTSFMAVQVFDISDTSPVVGWKGPKGESAFEPQALKIEETESVGEITAMIDAATAWGKSQNIDIDVEEMVESTGGYSAGGKVRINNAFEGKNFFSTLVHELGHEVLHQNAKDKSSGKKPKEIDAEATAYIVLSHYGFESKDAPNYLALWRASGEDVKDRRSSISKGVEQIIEGIDGAMSEMGVEHPDEEAGPVRYAAAQAVTTKEAARHGMTKGEATSLLDEGRVRYASGVEGEWWIEDGTATYADADIGDMGHEEIVLQRAWSEVADAIAESEKLQGLTKALEENYGDDVPAEEAVKDWFDSAAEEGLVTREEADDYHVTIAKETGLSEDLILAAFGWGDVREFGMIHWGMIRLAGTNVQMFDVNKSRLKELADGIYDTGIDQTEEDWARETFTIEDVHSGHVYWNVPWDVIEAGDMKALRDYRGDLGARYAAAVTPEEDARYMKLAEAGNEKAAQKLVDGAAKAAGYVLRAFHGSTETDITAFEDQKTAYGYFFSPDPDTAAYYTGGDLGEGRVYDVLLKSGRVLDLTDDLARSEFFALYFGEEGDTRIDEGKQQEYGEYIEADQGDVYDSVSVIYNNATPEQQAAIRASMEANYPDIFSEPLSVDWTLSEAMDYGSVDINDAINAVAPIDDSINEAYPLVNAEAERASNDYGTGRFYGYGRGSTQDDIMMFAEGQGYGTVILDDPSHSGESISYVVFDPTQIKSSDPITRDDAGNVIPLSKRFDPEVEDIRYAAAVTPEEDARLMELAKEPKKNHRELKSITRRLAREAGWTVAAVHGTPSGGFTVFDTKGERIGIQVDEDFEEELVQNVSGADPTAFIGSHFATGDGSKRVGNMFMRGIYAGKWTDPEKRRPQLYEVFLEMRNPRRFTAEEFEDFVLSGAVIVNQEFHQEWFDANKKDFDLPENADPFEMLDSDSGLNTLAGMYMAYTNEVSDLSDDAGLSWAKEVGEHIREGLVNGGYDSIVYENRIEGGTGAIVFEPNQVKSADPITRDDQGDIIPWSQRFQRDVKDIRYAAGRVPWSMSQRGEGDLYIRRVGPNAGQVTKDRQGPSDIALTTDKSVLLPDYLFYVLQSIQPDLNARKKGSVQQAITQKDIDDVLTGFFVKQDRDRVNREYDAPRFAAAAPVGSKEFKQWAGDSKPLLVYHGTRADVTIFKTSTSGMINQRLGTHLALDPRVTAAFSIGAYARDSRLTFGDQLLNLKGQVIKPGGRTIPLWLRMRNPMVLKPPSGRTGTMDQSTISRAATAAVFRAKPDAFVHWATSRSEATEEEAKKVWTALDNGESGEGAFGVTQEYLDAHDGDAFAAVAANYIGDFGPAYKGQEWPTFVAEEYKRILKAKGYDGIEYENTSDNEVKEGFDPTTYIAFDPDQMKSTLGNVGAYGQRAVTAEEAKRLGMTVKEAAFFQHFGDIRFAAVDLGVPPDVALATTPEEREQAHRAWVSKGVESPWFKRFFDGSKTLDSRGDPQVQLHATDQPWEKVEVTAGVEARQRKQRQINAIGAWFTADPEMANTIQTYWQYRPLILAAEQLKIVKTEEEWDAMMQVLKEDYLKGDKPEQRESGWGHMPGYLSIKNPLQIGQRGELEDALFRLVGERLGPLGVDPIVAAYIIRDRWNYDPSSRATIIHGMKKAMRDAGYDGIEVADDYGFGKVWVAVFPETVKSIWNYGTFMGDNIRYSASLNVSKAAGLAMTFGGNRVHENSRVRINEMAKWLRRQGVTQQELDWTGISDLSGTMTKGKMMDEVMRRQPLVYVPEGEKGVIHMQAFDGTARINYRTATDYDERTIMVIDDLEVSKITDDVFGKRLTTWAAAAEFSAIAYNTDKHVPGLPVGNMKEVKFTIDGKKLDAVLIRNSVRRPALDGQVRFAAEARRQNRGARQDLAKIGKDERVRMLEDIVDELRNMHGEPEKRTWKEDVFPEVKAILADKKRRAEYMENFLRKAARNESLSTDVETMVARELIVRAMEQGLDEREQRENPERALKKLGWGMVLKDLYRRSRAMTARALAMGRDFYETPAQRLKNHVFEAIAEPPEGIAKKLAILDDRLRKETNDVRIRKMTAQRAALLVRAAANTAGLREHLVRLGFDLTSESTYNDPRKAMAVIRATSEWKASKWDVTREYWMNAILSLPTTQMRNITGNTFNMVLEFTAQRLVEATINLLPGKNKASAATFSEMFYMYRALLPGLVKAGHNFLYAWDTESATFADEVRGQKLEVGERRKAIAGHLLIPKGVPIVGGKKLPWGRLIRTPTRTLLAVDEAFKTVVAEMEVQAAAYRIARQEGLTPGTAAFIEKFEALTAAENMEISPAWEMAMDKAYELTFQQELGTLGKLILEGRRRIPPTYFFMPFVTTPLNIFKMGIRKSPAGSLRMFWKAARKAWATKNDDLTYEYNRSMWTHDLAEQVISWSLVMALMSLVTPDDDDGLPWITGAQHLKPGERKLAYETAPPMSVRWPAKDDKGKWIWGNINGIEPFSVTVATSVDMINAFLASRNGEEGADTINRLLKTIRGQIRDKTFMRGLADLDRLLTEAHQAPKWATQFIGSWSPNLIRGIARAGDEAVRERRVGGGPLFPVGDTPFWDQVAHRTRYEVMPIGKWAPPPKVDTWGRDITKSADTPLTDWIARIFSPSRSIRIDDSTASHLSMMALNWNNANPSNTYTFSPPNTYFRYEGQTIHLTDDDYHDYVRESGKRALRRAEHRRWNFRNPTEKDMERLRSIILDARGDIRDRMKKTVIAKWEERMDTDLDRKAASRARLLKRKRERAAAAR